MSKRDIFNTCIAVLVPVMILIFIGVAVWQHSIQNDFNGEIKLVAEGRYGIQKDCFGEKIAITIGNTAVRPSLFSALFKIPQSNKLSGGECRWNRLVEGNSYILYEKDRLFGKSYFTECLK